MKHSGIQFQMDILWVNTVTKSSSVIWSSHQFTTWSLSVFVDFDVTVQNHWNPII